VLRVSVLILFMLAETSGGTEVDGISGYADVASGAGGGSDLVSIVRMGLGVPFVTAVCEVAITGSEATCLLVVSVMLVGDGVWVLARRVVALAIVDELPKADLVMWRCILTLVGGWDVDGDRANGSDIVA
jgi:hypothetical protein